MTRAPLDLFTAPLDGIRLIEASAGTGKTWHVCGLVLRLLLERGLELPQILVLTFTNAATAELRERIRARVVETLELLQGGDAHDADPFVPALLRHLRDAHGLDDATLALRLRLALQSFDEAAIFTLHGFCQRALAELPFAAGLPLALAPLADDSPLLLQAVHDFWRRHVATEDLDPALAAHLAARRDTPRKFAALLARRLSKPLSPTLWPAALDEAADGVPTAGLAEAFNAARACWQSGREAVAQALREAAPGLYAQSYGAESIATALAGWQHWIHGGDALAPLDLDGDKLELLGAGTLAQRTRKGSSPPVHPFFGLADALLAARRRADGQLELARLRLLRRLFEEAGAALRQRKRELRVAAFDDMLFNLHERLQAVPALAAALRARFPAALIDEFQDTDPLQWAIVEKVWGEADAPLLLVGDPKQAIYGFRNADLHTYLRARERAVAVYTLDRNQRSSAALVSALNHLFLSHGRGFLLPGLEIAPVGVGARPRPAFEDGSPAAGDLGALQLWLLPRGQGDQPPLREAALRAAVQATAAEIARLLREGRAGRMRVDGRPLAGGNVAVLVRSHAQGALVRQALAALGVGSVALSPASVFHAPEAGELHSVLAAVLEPAHAGRLRAALATETMGFDAAALEALDRDETALAAHLERFAGWRACWLQHGVAAMLRRWLQEAGVAARLLARPDGARRLTNLLHLGERLHEAAELQGVSAEGLLRWLALRRAQPGTEEADQLRLESDQALVRIVTIHKAKGLEYGIVFCPFLWDAQAPPAAAPGMVDTHDAEGRPVLDLRAGCGDARGEAALKQRQRAEQAAETLRLAYVALTRAGHRCYLVVGPYTARAGKGFSTQAGTHAVLNWLAAGDGYPDAAQWIEHGLQPADIEAAWRRLAAGNDAIRLAPLPSAPGEPLPPAPARRLEALPAPRRIGAGWRVLDGDALEREPVPAADAGSEHDAREPPGTARAALARDDVLRFPDGPAAADAIRLALARADFTDPASWEDAAWAALRVHPQPGTWGSHGEARERAQAAMLQRMLQDVLSTEIAPGLRLRHLERGRWLSALELTLPVSSLAAGELAALGLPEGSAQAPETPGGYLRGVVDLVFEHAGRWWLLDWSAARPGLRARDYGAEALARDAAARGYEQQALLHTLALQRWLRQRVPGWRPEAHFGGALRLYVRGVRPGWRQEDGTACGVYRFQATQKA